MSKKDEATKINSEEYLKKINQIVELKQAYEKRSADARKQIDRLESQLTELSNNLLVEIDPGKIKIISESSRDIRYQIDDFKLLLNADIKGMIKLKIQELRSDPSVQQAEKEFKEYSQWHDEEIKRLNKETEEKVRELELQSRTHPYLTAGQIHQGLLYSIRA